MPTAPPRAARSRTATPAVTPDEVIPEATDDEELTEQGDTPDTFIPGSFLLPPMPISTTLASNLANRSRVT